jgi:hypothetical protein
MQPPFSFEAGAYNGFGPFTGGPVTSAIKGRVMKRSAGLLAILFVPAFMLAGVIANSAMAQEKAKAKAAPLKQELKVLLENDKVRVYEARSKPGAESEMRERPFRVIRYMTDATILRTNADGKTETLRRKAGEVRAAGPDQPYKTKNVGKRTYVVYVVQPK